MRKPLLRLHCKFLPDACVRFFLDKGAFHLKRGLLAVLFCLFWIAPTPVAAAGAEFTVTPNTTGSSAAGYYQYRLQPQTQTTLTATIHNTAAATQRFNVNIIDAGVSSSGQLLYTPGANLTATTGPTLASMATPLKQTVSVAAHASKTVQVTLRVPQTSWYGERLGALSVAAIPAAGKQSGLQNRFVLATPLHLTIAHVDESRPKLTLSNTKLSQRNVTADLASHTARLFGGITIHSTLQNSAKQTLASATIKNAQMAPNAIMPLRLPVTKALTAGTYTLVIDLTSGKQHYHLTDHFTITAAQASRTDMAQPAVALAWWVYALIGLVISLLGVIGWLLWQQRRAKHDAN